MEQDNNEATPVGEFECVIRAKDTLIRKLQHQLDNYESNPIRAELIRLLNHDMNVKQLLLDLGDVRATVEFEVDDQVCELRNNLLDEIDEKLDDQFESNAFKIAVDDYIRSKF